jgi:hypothetical protein
MANGYDVREPVHPLPSAKWLKEYDNFIEFAP